MEKTKQTGNHSIANEKKKTELKGIRRRTNDQERYPDDYRLAVAQKKIPKNPSPPVLKTDNALLCMW